MGGPRGGAALDSARLKRILLVSAGGGLLIAALQLVEYQHFVRAVPGEVYGGVIALIFTGVGAAVGLKWTRSRERVVVHEVRVPADGPFVPDAARREALGITAREQEVLDLIAEGLSNREIGERLFVSENTVKTHSARLFGKLGVDRRVRAVQEARRLRLIP